VKSFTTAAKSEQKAAERQEKIDTLVAERQDKIEALIAEGASREDAEAKIRKDAEKEVDFGKPIEFDVDGRTLRAYKPTNTQLIFLMASHGRGQTNTNRFASSVNMILECLEKEDRDYLDSLLLSREDGIDEELLEEIFEYLTEKWFGTDHPTPPSSGSV
jgi:hypothetical protein